MRDNFDYDSKKRNAPLRVITQRVAMFQDNLSSDPWLLRMVPIVCPEKSVQIYQYSLRNNTEERSSQLHRGGSLKSSGSKKLGIFFLKSQ
jgi:hypothetical protein